MEAPSMKEILKERWKQHYRNRSFLITYRQANYVGVSYTLYAFFVGYYYAMFRLIPLVYDVGDGNGSLLVPRLLATFILFELLCNWMQCARKYLNAVRVQKGDGDRNPSDGSASGRDAAPQQLPAAGWRHCPICQLYAPPRSHHCKLCQACMLKHDHHCFFTAGCIGFHTQRNFLYLSLWTIAGHAYVTYLIARCYAHLSIPSASSWSAYIIVLTPIHWLIGHVSLGEALAVVQIYLALPVFVVAVFYAFVGILLACRNQTLWELGKGITKYDVGFFENMRSALGSDWLLGLIVPWWPTLPGDGYSYPLSKQLKVS